MNGLKSFRSQMLLLDIEDIKQLRAYRGKMVWNGVVSVMEIISCLMNAVQAGP